MQYRKFGRLPVEVSDIGFGAWQIGGAWGEVTEADGRAALEAALEAGVTSSIRPTSTATAAPSASSPRC